jgi:hypothetical protein
VWQTRIGGEKSYFDQGPDEATVLQITAFRNKARQTHNHLSLIFRSI